MGLKKNDHKPKVRVYDLDEELDFGKFTMCTPREIIDDDEYHILEWYIENVDGFGLTNDAHDYMSRRANGV